MSYIYPVLYKKEKNGKTRVWKASTKDSTATYEYGQENGKMQISTREYSVGKNIGKKNETTAKQQCEQETLKKWKDKKNKEGYTELGEEKKYTLYPMLAHTFNPTKSHIVFPCLVQPKLDGFRCLIYNKGGTIVFQSRTGKEFTKLDHVSNELIDLNIILDGELFSTEMPFEELSGLIKKQTHSSAEKEKLKLIKFHVYDTISNDNFVERIKIVNQFNSNHVKLVETHECNTLQEFNLYFSKFIEQGYEGIILRNKIGPYECGVRSNNLQKHKEFKEDEFQIVGYKEAEGRDIGTIVWICKTLKGTTFSVRPKGSLEHRKNLLKNAETYIGMFLTVVYQELHNDDVPRFPVGKDVRSE